MTDTSTTRTPAPDELPVFEEQPAEKQVLVARDAAVRCLAVSCIASNAMDVAAEITAYHKSKNYTELVRTLNVMTKSVFDANSGGNRKQRRANRRLN